MYFNASEMKKMLKESWETNMLILSRKDDRILIQGNSWILATDIDLIPNKIRASIVELTGELPAEGYTFRSGKGQTNQYEFEQTVFWDELLNMETTYSAANKAERTRIAIYSKQFNADCGSSWNHNNDMGRIQDRNQDYGNWVGINNYIRNSGCNSIHKWSSKGGKRAMGRLTYDNDYMRLQVPSREDMLNIARNGRNLNVTLMHFRRRHGLFK